MRLNSVFRISWIKLIFTKMAHFSVGNVGEYNELTEILKSYTERVLGESSCGRQKSISFVGYYGRINVQPST